MSVRRTRGFTHPALAACALVVALAGLSGCAPSTVPVASSAPGGSSAKPHVSAVPAPGNGTIDQTVAPVDPATIAITKASLDQPAVLPSRVTIAVLSATSTTVSAHTPGEIAGPAIVALVKITNGTSASLDLGSTVVSLLDNSGNPGQATTAGPARPFSGSVAPGKSLEATYVFGVPAGTNPVQISVAYAGGAPEALFTGNAS
jgi:hypothetical protein